MIIDPIYREVFTTELPLVGRFRFLGENESGLLFGRNKIWRFVECTIPYNRPAPSESLTSLTSVFHASVLLLMMDFVITLSK